MRTRELGSIAVTAIGLGCTHFDTAEGYGDGDNEVPVGEAMRPVRKDVALAAKFLLAEGKLGRSAEAHVHAKPEASPRWLDADRAELHYQHRVSPGIPAEEIAVVMGKLVAEGRILGRGRSQATAEQIRRAHAASPLLVVRSEYSMMERTFKRDVIPPGRGTRHRLRAVLAAGERFPLS